VLSIGNQEIYFAEIVNLADTIHLLIDNIEQLPELMITD